MCMNEDPRNVMCLKIIESKMKFRHVSRDLCYGFDSYVSHLINQSENIGLYSCICGSGSGRS